MSSQVRSALSISLLRALRVLCVLCGCSAVEAACGADVLKPATLDTRGEMCASCRMAVSSRSTASQIVAPGEEPRFFDDLGCLVKYLRQHDLPDGARVFVADHRTSAWVADGTAIYTRVPQLDTPMGSHLIAHADAASRDADPAARGGQPIEGKDIFGGAR